MRMTTPLTMTAGMLVAVHLVAGAGRPAHADPLGCDRALLAASAKLAKAALRALGACEVRKRSGRLPLLAPCTADPKTAAALAKARAQLRHGLDTHCGGADGRCGTGDDESLATLGWPTMCPDFEGADCTNAVTDCVGVATCQACVAEAATDRALALLYRRLVPIDPTRHKALRRCQTTIGKEGAKLLDVSWRALTRCWDARARGKHANVCPEPGDGRAAPALAAAAATARVKICKACGGPDHTCDGIADLGVAEIGFDATCPGAGGCVGGIATISDLADCVACTSAARARCAVALAVPGLTGYPPGCGAPLPTPTPTVTPPPTATPTATATPLPLACPVAAPGAATTSVTITLTAPAPIGAASLLLAYPPARVRLPAPGGGAEVRARVTDLTGGALFDQGAPNNQDGDGDGEADRVRFTLVAPAGVGGAVVRLEFDRCDGASLTDASAFACTLVAGTVVATDGVTPVEGAGCGLAVTHADAVPFIAAPGLLNRPAAGQRTEGFSARRGG